jgi:hypothetical protein
MAYLFNGSTSYLEKTSLPVVNVPITIAAWFNSTVINSLTKVMVQYAAEPVGGASGTTGNSALTLRLVLSTGIVQAAHSQNNGTAVGNSDLTGATAAINTWQHGAAKFTSMTSRTAYLNGVPGIENTTLRNSVDYDNVIIGRGSGGTYSLTSLSTWTGRLAEVGIWAAALTDSEILSLARGYRPTMIRPQSLLHYIPIVRDLADYRENTPLTNANATVDIHTRRYS